jgi:hypothetical protein
MHDGASEPAIAGTLRVSPGAYLYGRLFGEARGNAVLGAISFRVSGPKLIVSFPSHRGYPGASSGWPCVPKMHSREAFHDPKI